jgi:hypothetical protein
MTGRQWLPRDEVLGRAVAAFRHISGWAYSSMVCQGCVFRAAVVGSGATTVLNWVQLVLSGVFPGGVHKRRLL